MTLSPDAPVQPQDSVEQRSSRDNNDQNLQRSVQNDIQQQHQGSTWNKPTDDVGITNVDATGVQTMYQDNSLPVSLQSAGSESDSSTDPMHQYMTDLSKVLSASSQLLNDLTPLNGSASTQLQGAELGLVDGVLQLDNSVLQSAQAILGKLDGGIDGSSGAQSGGCFDVPSAVSNTSRADSGGATTTDATPVPSTRTTATDTTAAPSTGTSATDAPVPATGTAGTDAITATAGTNTTETTTPATGGTTATDATSAVVASNSSPGISSDSATAVDATTGSTSLGATTGDSASTPTTASLDTSVASSASTGDTSSILPNKIMMAYFTENGPTISQLMQEAPQYNVLDYASAVPSGNANADMTIDTSSDPNLASEIVDWKASGRTAILMVQNENNNGGTINLNTDADVTNFVNSISNLVTNYGFQGIDWDLEDSFTQSSPQAVVEATQELKDKFGSSFIISASPRDYEVRNDGAWGQTLHEMGNNLDLIQLQEYDEGVYADPNFAQIQADYADAVAQGFDPNKLILGTEGQIGTYAPGVAADPQTYADAFTYLENTYGIRGANVWDTASDSWANFANSQDLSNAGA